MESVWHFDGTRWNPIAKAGSLLEMIATGRAQAWAVGTDGIRAATATETLAATQSSQGLGSAPRAWSLAPDDVWVAGEERLLHFDGKSWHPVASPGGQAAEVVWASGPSQRYVGTKQGLFVSDGDRWQQTGKCKP